MGFDPFSDAFFDDPYPTYTWLRDNDPVHFNPQYGFYALSRYADVIAAHSDTDRLVSSYGLTVEILMLKQKLDNNMMILLDPPEHTQQRKLVSQAFTRRTIEGLEPLVVRTVTRFLDELEGRDNFDIVAEFSALFPVEVISAMLGVPAADRQQVRHWTDAFLHRRPGDPRTTKEGIEASLEMAVYFLELAKEKRKHPDDLIISKLVEVEMTDGNDGKHRLTDDEVAGFSVLIAGAGSETVTKLVGSGVVLFDAHPDQWERVLADESSIPGAVEEILRMHPPSQYQGRFAVEDVTFEGGTIPAGSPTLLLTGAATRDPRACESPDVFDITRGGHTTLAFGYGAHSCLGAWLARLESRVAFSEIRRRWPRFEVDPAGLRRVNMSNVAGYSHVPVHVG
ncbi:MAG: cytochrome [Actinomycetia bacterium]|nr:cytochrome [Actinomycetes bacterium]